jgi:predicted permease
MQALWQDVRHAARLMRQSAVFTAIAVASLALAIGVNTSVFSLLNAVVLRPLPAPRADQLVLVETVRSGSDAGLSFQAFEELGRTQQAFSSLVGYMGDGIFNIEMNGTLVRGDVWAVTGRFHSMLGVTPIAGRLLTDADVNLSTRTPAMVAVLGYGLWQREFGGSESIVGQAIRIEGVPFTIAGIAPAGFTGFGITSEPDVTIALTAAPLIMPGVPAERFVGGSRGVSTVGRLKDTRTLDSARAEIEAIWPAIRERTMPPAIVGKERDEVRATAIRVSSAERGKEWFLRSRFSGPLYVVLGVGGLILMIACVNLASLTLSRAAARGHEMSIRLALGASRSRLVRQMITEGLLLAALGALGGLFFATWSSRALATLMTRDYLVPSVLDLSPDARVLAFTAAVAALAGVLFSAVPAWRVTTQHPAATLRQHARSFTAGGRAGKLLIVTQVALSIVLLMDAGLLVRTLQQLRSVEFGFSHDGVFMAGLFPRPDGYKNLNPDRYYPELLERIAAMPGVQSVAMTRVRPGSGESKQAVAAIDAPEGGGVASNLGRVGPGYFDVVRMRVESGRAFEWSDNSSANRVAVVSHALAASLFQGETSIGRHIRIGTAATRRDLEIVGVVSDARLFNPRDPGRASVYVPVLQEGEFSQWSDVVIRTAAGPPDANELRRTVQSLGRESVLTYRPMQQVVDRAILQERVTAMLGGFFGALALALAAIGLYGLMACAVNERRKEIAIRVALGSARAGVIGMVIRDALTLVAAGLIIGVPAALASGRLVASLLFGLTPTDPLTLIGTSIALITIGAIGGYIPGRRASRIDPAEALKL